MKQSKGVRYAQGPYRTQYRKNAGKKPRPFRSRRFLEEPTPRDTHSDHRVSLKSAVILEQPFDFSAQALILFEKEILTTVGLLPNF